MKTIFAIFREMSEGKKPIVIFPYLVNNNYEVLCLENYKFTYNDYFTIMKMTNEPTLYCSYDMLEIRKYLKSLKYKIKSIEKADEKLLVEILQLNANRYAHTNKLSK